MTDNIKIVYNWIGPRGPIMNTEVPNILQIAGVTDGVQTTSRRFSAEYLWSSLFRDNGFVMTPACVVDNDTGPFIVSFTLMWRIAFEAYFNSGNGLVEYSMLSEAVTHHIKHKSGYILIEVAAEAWVANRHLDVLHSYFTRLGIPLHKIIYLTGCANAESVYSNYCATRGISEESRLRLITYSAAAQRLAQCRMYAPEYVDTVYQPDVLPSKLFLSWNRRMHQHRIIIALALSKAGILQRSYFSFLKDSPDNHETFESTAHLTKLQQHGIEQVDIDNFKNMLPLVLDGETDIQKMCDALNDGCRKYYADSLISIVTETNFTETELTLTEKSYKPFQEKHPFITVASPGALAAMHSMGFRTFSEFWSERYDTIQNPTERLQEIINVCHTIASWSDKQILRFKREVQPILEHNSRLNKVNPSIRVSDLIKQHIHKGIQ